MWLPPHLRCVQCCGCGTSSAPDPLVQLRLSPCSVQLLGIRGQPELQPAWHMRGGLPAPIVVQMQVAAWQGAPAGRRTQRRLRFCRTPDWEQDSEAAEQGAEAGQPRLAWGGTGQLCF